MTAAGGVVWVASGNNLVGIDQVTGDVVARWNGPAGINDIAAMAGSLWLVNSAEQVVRLSARNPGRAGVTTLGVIATGVVAGYGWVWAVGPALYGAQMALWRLDPISTRVTQITTFGSPRPGYPPTLSVALGGGAIWSQPTTTASSCESTRRRATLSRASTLAVILQVSPTGRTASG